MDPQLLSTVVNAPIISSFLSSDPNHLSIFDTLLESRITGVDSEIRTEYEDGTVTRFPVLILCLDGLGRLLEKHGKAKELLEEKIRAEAGQTGAHGQLVQSLPLARTGVLSAGGRSNEAEVEVLRKKLAAEYAEESKKLKEELEAEYAAGNAKLREEMERSFRERLAKREQELQAEAAKELARLKTELLADTAKDAARQSDGLAEEFARCEKVREEIAAEQLAMEKQKLEKSNTQVLAKLKEDLRNKAADDINEYKRLSREGNEEGIAKFKNKLRDETREEQTKLLQKQRSEDAENYRNMKKKLEKGAADELAKLKEDLRKEAADDLDDWKRKLNDKPSAEQLSKEKERLRIEAAMELSTLQTELRNKAAEEVERFRTNIEDRANRIFAGPFTGYNKEFKKRMELNRKNFINFRNQCVLDLSGVHLTDKAAVKLLARSPTIFNKYRDLCVDALKKYKKELKEQYQKHLEDIEWECRAWLRRNAGSGLKIEVMEGFRRTIERGTSFDPKIQSIKEDVGGQITMEVLQQEANEIIADFEAQQQKSIFEGGLGLPLLDTQTEATKLAIENTDRLAVVDNFLDSMSERTFLGASLKELQAKARQATNVKTLDINAVEPQIQVEHEESVVSKIDQGKALGKLSSDSPAANLGGTELGERRVNIEQQLRQKNYSTAVSKMGLPKLRPASLWYAAEGNVPMSTTNANRVFGIAYDGAAQARMEPNARESRSKVKDSTTKFTIDRFRGPNDGDIGKSKVPSILQLDNETETREASDDFPLTNKRGGTSRINMEAEGLIVRRQSKEPAPNPTVEMIQRANEADENSKLAEIETRIENILLLEPLASQAFNSKQEIFETMYSGKTVSEIYEILHNETRGKRKRLSDSDGSDNMPLRKKADQHACMKK
jgi:hypothetical protein